MTLDSCLVMSARRKNETSVVPAPTSTIPYSPEVEMRLWPPMECSSPKHYERELVPRVRRRATTDSRRNAEAGRISGRKVSFAPDEGPQANWRRFQPGYLPVI